MSIGVGEKKCEAVTMMCMILRKGLKRGLKGMGLQM